MINSNAILNMAKDNNGIITNNMVVSKGYSRGSLKYLSDKGYLEKVSRGVYILPNEFEDEFINIQNRFKKGIFSLETALFLCELTDLTPSKYSMTFPSTYNLSKPKEIGILCNSSKEEFYNLGITNLITPYGNYVKSYGAEKTLCDILKTKNHIDIQVIVNSFKIYVKQKNKNIPLLSKYAKILNVENKIRTYLEILL